MGGLFLFASNDKKAEKSRCYGHQFAKQFT